MPWRKPKRTLTKNAMPHFMPVFRILYRARRIKTDVKQALNRSTVGKKFQRDRKILPVVSAFYVHPAGSLKLSFYAWPERTTTGRKPQRHNGTNGGVLCIN
jgi:hypothetical protein